jgi:hypothetical protein
MIYVAPLMEIVQSIEYWWLTQTARKHTRGEVQVPKTALYIETVAIFFFVITMASLDTGTGIDAIHGFAAVCFFVLMFIGLFKSTCILKKCREYSPSVISANSLKFKEIINYLMIFTAIYGVGATLLKDFIHHGKWHHILFLLGNSAEWVGVTLLNLYLGSFSWDWPNLEIVISSPSFNAKKKKKRCVNGIPVSDNGFYIGLVYPQV